MRNSILALTVALALNGVGLTAQAQSSCNKTSASLHQGTNACKTSNGLAVCPSKTRGSDKSPAGK